VKPNKKFDMLYWQEKVRITRITNICKPILWASCYPFA